MTHDTGQMRFRLTQDLFLKNIPSVTYVDTDHGNATGSLDKKRNSAHGRPKWIGPWQNLKGVLHHMKKSEARFIFEAMVLVFGVGQKLSSVPKSSHCYKNLLFSSV